MPGVLRPKEADGSNFLGMLLVRFWPRDASIAATSVTPDSHLFANKFRLGLDLPYHSFHCGPSVCTAEESHSAMKPLWADWAAENRQDPWENTNTMPCRK